MTAAALARRRAKARKAPAARRVDLASAKPPTADKGTSGGVAYGGVLAPTTADYAAAWHPPRRWQTIETMRADPAVSAVMAALTYPILSTPLRVEPASDDPEDVARAEFIAEGLENMTVSEAAFRMEALDSVGDGVTVFYTRYEKREDGLWWLRKPKLLPNKSITEWNADEKTGDPTGVTQLRPDGQLEFIPIEELVIFSHGRRGGMLWGRPVLRTMYRPWFAIDKATRIGLIAIERTGVGIPWARYTGGGAAEASALDNALMGLHAHDQAFIRVDEDTPEIGFLAVNGSTVDAVPMMEYQRRDLFLAALAQFLALGSDATGAFALSRDHSSFFLMALRSIAGEFEDTINRYLIPRWIGYNWTIAADRMPKVKHGAIDQRSALDWANAVAAIMGAGVQLPAEELSKGAAELLGLTLPEVAEPSAAGAVSDVNDPNAPDVGADGEIEQRAGRRRLWAGLNLPDAFAPPPASAPVTLAAAPLKSPVMFETLGIAPNFVRMSEAMDAARDRIAKRVAPRQKAIAGKVARDMERIAKRRDADALEGYDIPYEDEAGLIEEELRTVYGLGGDELASELRAQGVTPASPGSDREAAALLLIGATSRSYAERLADRMKTAAVSAALQQIVTGRVDRAALALAIVGAPESLLGQLGAQGAALALNIGRSLWADANAAKIDRFINSEVMDGVTCGPCRDADGVEFGIEDMGKYAPYEKCEGGARCRGIAVPVVK